LLESITLQKVFKGLLSGCKSVAGITLLTGCIAHLLAPGMVSHPSPTPISVQCGHIVNGLFFGARRLSRLRSLSSGKRRHHLKKRDRSQTFRMPISRAGYGCRSRQLDSRINEIDQFVARE
jgi:hypothetical protein